jgi:VPDSG-CTERM motif
MKKTFAAVITITALAVPTLFANTMSTVGGPGGWGPYQTGQGGEFTFQSSDLGAVINGYYSGAKNQVTGANPSFQTFCVEGAETVAGNTTYTFAFNSKTVASANQPLSVGAAFLYSQFASGALLSSTPGYDYGTDAGRLVDAGLLQNAIWHYMGGIEGTISVDSSNPYETYASLILGGDAAAQAVASVGLDGVSVLNSFNLNGTGAQDMLIWNSPDGGTTVMLLGMGLMGLVFISRRLALAR